MEIINKIESRILERHEAESFMIKGYVIPFIFGGASGTIIAFFKNGEMKRYEWKRRNCKRLLKWPEPCAMN